MEDDQDRLVAELMLLEATYPDQISYDTHARELKFNGDHHSSLSLRIPQDYPSVSLPEILSATGPAKLDLRQELRKRTHAIQPGEEVLDIFVNAIQELVTTQAQSANAKPASAAKPQDQPPDQGFLTIIIWLHHLLATSKRKLAIAPGPAVAGITKPGYPGVMLFTGPAAAVRSHVDTLKQENWQAFQIRLEDAELWPLVHGKGVIEVESMGDVVKDVGAARKEVFLEAMKIK